MGRTSDARRKLLQVAFDLLWINSYGSIGVDEICRRAGVRKGSFYHFFPSKSDLVAEAYAEAWRQIEKDLLPIFAPTLPPVERIRRLLAYEVETQHRKFEEHGHVCGCPFASIGAELAFIDETVRRQAQAALDSATALVRGTVEDGIRDGSFVVDHPERAARRFISCLVGLLIDARIHNDLGLLADFEPTMLGMLGVPLRLAAA